MGRFFATARARQPLRDAVDSEPSENGRLETAQLNGTFPSTPFHPLSPSPEQAAVVRKCAHTNVSVSARPGSGKTATAESIVAAYPDVPTAVITYSKRLQLHTAQKLEQYPLADVYTFHGIAGRLFRTIAHTDTVLRDLRKKGASPTWTGPLYQRLILDEIQDMTPELYWVTCVLISALTHGLPGGQPPNLVVLGDARQAIYEFRGADARCLIHAHEVFARQAGEAWADLTLNQSFRLSHATAAFVNDVFLHGEQYIEGSHNEGGRPIYLHADLFDVASLTRALVPLINEYGVDRSAIIAPFVRDNTSLSRLTNRLSSTFHIPVAVSTSDNISLDQTVLNGKLAVSTYHQFKGSERDLVVVYGADASYFDFMGRDLHDDRCPNATFVALTRARKQLVVVQSDRFPPMPFMRLPQLPQRAHFRNLSPDNPKAQYPPGRPLRTGLLLPTHVPVSDMVRHVQGEIVERIVAQHLEITTLAAPLPRALHIVVPDKVRTHPHKQHFEAVSDLNGFVVTAAYEWDVARTLTTFGYRQRKPDLPPEGATPRWLAREATAYEARVSGYESRKLQMTGHAFDWLDTDLEAARERLKAELPPPHLKTHRLEFEMAFRQDFAFHEGGYDHAGVPLDVQETRVAGCADIVVSELHSSGRGKTKEKAHPVVWEIKFVSELTLDHVLQVTVYGYLYAQKMKMKSMPRLILFNVRDGAKWEVHTTVAKAEDVIKAILRAKYTSAGEVPLEQFLEGCRKISDEVDELHGRLGREPDPAVDRQA